MCRGNKPIGQVIPATGNGFIFVNQPNVGGGGSSGGGVSAPVVIAPPPVIPAVTTPVTPPAVVTPPAPVLQVITNADIPNTVTRVSQDASLNIITTTSLSVSGSGTYDDSGVFDSEASYEEQDELASASSAPSSFGDDGDKNLSRKKSRKTSQMLKNLRGILTIDPVLAKRYGIVE